MLLIVLAGATQVLVMLLKGKLLMMHGAHGVGRVSVKRMGGQCC